jgi:hypothetical protein
MVDNPVWQISERVAEVQALLDDEGAGGAVGSRAAAGDVRRRLLPAEHAARDSILTSGHRPNQWTWVQGNTRARILIMPTEIGSLSSIKSGC